MLLTANGIAKTYFRDSKGANYFYAVQKTDFTLEAGTLTEVIGRSGSGKTTFASMLCGLLSPSEGNVMLGDRDLYALNDRDLSMLRNQTFGIIPQGQTGLRSLTVLENVLAPVAMYGDSREAEERAHSLLSQMEIDDLSEVYANELSGGEMRRMAIARGLIRKPRIIVADEPTGDLDDETTAMVLKLFRDCADQGAAVLIITHEREALNYADRVYKMNKGILSPYGE